MGQGSVVIPAERLEAWAGQLLRAHGLSPDHAAAMASILVDADLHGVGTHGLAQLPDYASRLAGGALSARPRLRIEDTGPMIRIEADHAPGQLAGAIAADLASRAARGSGLAGVAISSAGHYGALGSYTRRIAQGGQVALMMQNGPPLMALPGSRQRAIGNNPISIAAPLSGRPPFVLDMSASVAAYGKIMAAEAGGEPLPMGWALDGDGAPTTDPGAALAGMLCPAGGAKGIGLAMIVECLAGSLTGTRPVWGEGIFGAFLLVIDPARGIGQEAFLSHMAGWVAHYEGSGPDNRYPGARSAAIAERYRQVGIPIEAGLFERLDALGRSHALPLPKGTG